MTRRRSLLSPTYEPTTTILTLLTTTTFAHILPQRTTTLPYQTLDVLPYPIPTAALFPRQEALNTICGYIGGDPGLPATCSAGSYCAVDVAHNAIGCCPDGDVACTTGVYTACVDGDSPPQNAIDPYVFTCGSGDGACDRNEFEGGFSQFGCGGSAATVQRTASGKPSLDLESISVEMTEQPSTLSEPTTLGTGTRTRTRTLSTSRTTDTTEGSTTATRTTEEQSATQTSDGPADVATNAPENSGKGPNTGAIVGGTLGGVAFVAMLVLLALYLLRRRRRNSRQGPGPQGDTQFIR
jgi:LPXTG-motif cell wall-anchored protein